MKKINIHSVDEVVYKETLPSGLNVYIYTSPIASVFDMNLIVHVGSRNNSFYLDEKEINIPNGVAHFLEHLTFNTKDGSVEDYYSKRGAYVNASTSFDSTIYNVKCSESFEDNLLYLLDFVTSPFYTKDLVEKERGIILEEILTHMNNIEEKFYYKFCDNLFVNDTIKNPIGGIDKDVKKISLDDIVNTYNTFYKKNNMDLVLTGNIDVEDTINKLIEWDKKSLVKSIIKKNQKEEPNKVNRNEYSFNDLVSSKKMMFGYKLLKESTGLNDVEIDVYSLLLSDIMFGESSDIKLISETEGFIDGYVDSFFINGYKHKVFAFEFESDDLDKAYNKIINYINNYKVNEEDLSRKIKVLISQLILSFEDPQNYCGVLSNHLVKYGRVIDDFYDILKDITVDKINHLLDLYRKSPSTYIKLLPME